MEKVHKERQLTLNNGIKNMPNKIVKKSSRKNIYTKAMISSFFELPLSKAAEELNISESYLKRICRRFNIKNWPYRQLKRINEHLKSIKKELYSNHVTNRNQLLLELENLENQRRIIHENPENAGQIEICPFYRGNHIFEFKINNVREKESAKNLRKSQSSSHHQVLPRILNPISPNHCSGYVNQYSGNGNNQISLPSIREMFPDL